VYLKLTDGEARCIAHVIGRAIPRLSGQSLGSSFREGYNPEREKAIREAFNSPESGAARRMLQRWQDRGEVGLKPSREEAKGLHLLLTVILGPNRRPGGVMKGLSVIGLIEDDGMLLYKTRCKIEDAL